MTGYTPVRLAYSIMEPFGGANTNLSPIIFLHGTTETKECWGDIPQNVADRSNRKVFSLDTRNHGDSEWGDVFNQDVTVLDLVHFMDSQGIDRAVLIGHSMGGVTCMQTAFKHPPRVECVFVVDMFAHRMPQRILDCSAGYVRAYLEGLAVLRPGCGEQEAQQTIQEHVVVNNALAEAMLVFCSQSSKERKQASNRKQDYRFKKPTVGDVPLMRDGEGRLRLKYDSTRVLRAFATSESLMSDIEGVYEGPAYFIYGKDSPFNVGLDSHRIMKHFPQAKMTEIKGATHNVYLDAPIQLTQEILNHL